MSRLFLERYGPWALVTGASSGIGEQFARVLAERGFHLVIAARRRELLDQLAAELGAAHGVQVDVLELDLGAADFMDRLLAATAGKDVGLLVSNAGFGLKGLHHLQDPAQLDRMLDVNARAPTLIARAYAPQLIERGRGGLLFTGSLEGFASFPWSAAYAASKAYARSLGEALWGELKPHGVDVLLLAPGATDTEAVSLQGFDRTQLRGLMPPRDVVEMALARLAKGPVFVPGVMNRAMVRFLTLLPRRWAILVAGKGTKAAMDKAARVREAAPGNRV
ncbi:MAG TPA: SDR family NAD(P)-dependent oxidoreductase [Solimonas sp.]|nr:SDR family NAD(P)-dependent oxidoreductase [Solimonas sp.]